MFTLSIIVSLNLPSKGHFASGDITLLNSIVIDTAMPSRFRLPNKKYQIKESPRSSKFGQLKDPHYIS